MPNNQKLPTEILEQIFYFLPARDRLACQYVCKSWHSEAKPDFYQDVVIQGIDCSQRCVSFLEDDASDNGLYVKTLTFKRAAGEGKRKKLPAFPNKDVGPRSVTFLPNLIKIRVGETNPFYMLLTLKDAASNSKMKLNKLKKISIPKKYLSKSGSSKELSFDQLGFASTITKLDILNSIWNIECLSIRGPQKNRSIVDLSSILAHTSKLNKFKFDRSRLNIKPEDLSTGADHTTLKKLNLDLLRLTQFHIKYIMKMFPNLEFLKLDHAASNQEKQEVVNSFKEYAVRLKDTKFLIDKPDNPDYVESFTLNSPAN